MRRKARGTLKSKEEAKSQFYNKDISKKSHGKMRRISYGGKQV